MYSSDLFGRQGTFDVLAICCIQFTHGESVKDSSYYFNPECSWDQTTWAGFNHLVFHKYLFHQNILFLFHFSKVILYRNSPFKEN